MVWSVTNYTGSDHLGRPGISVQKDEVVLKGKKWARVNKTVTLQFGIFSDEPQECLRFMEQFSVEFDRAYTFYVKYPEPYDDNYYELEILEIQNSDFAQLDRDSKGSLTKFGFSFNVTFPLARLINEAKLFSIQPGQFVFDSNVVNNPSHFSVLFTNGIDQLELNTLIPCFDVI